MAKDIIKRAMSGDEKAMLELYDKNKSMIMCLCQALLLDENEADNATAYIFKNLFEELAGGRIGSEQDFVRMLIRRTIIHCKAKILQKNKRAFRTPVNSSFAATYDKDKMSFTGSYCQMVLKNLPEYQRFVYVIHTVADYSADEISRLFTTTAKIVEAALDAEQTNIDRIIAAYNKRNQKPMPFNLEAFHAQLMMDVEAMKIPAAVDATVKLNIRSICEPMQKRQKLKNGIVIVACGVLTVLACVLLITGSSGKTDESVDLDNADSDKIMMEGEYLTDEADITEEDVYTPAEINASHYAEIAIEDYGTIKIALDESAAPETVANFVALAEEGFYDGLTFHRIIEGFMMQGGDPNGDGTGGSDETIYGEFADNGFENKLSHTRGAVSMARSSDYDSASSQFFIVHEDSLSLDGQYAVFGYVVEGIEIVDAICQTAEPTDTNGSITEEDQPVISSIIVYETEAEELVMDD